MTPRIVRAQDGALRPRPRPPEVDRPPARLPGQLRDASCAPTPTSARSAPRACRTRRRPRCSTPTTCSRGCASSSATHLPLAFGELCMHEFVLSGAPMKRELGIRTLDLAKRLLDHGFHPPTVYFPLLVDEALLVEPTETETQGDARRLRRGDRRDPARGAPRIPEVAPQRAVHDAGAPPRRGRRRQAPGHPPAALGSRRERGPRGGVRLVRRLPTARRSARRPPARSTSPWRSAS